MNISIIGAGNIGGTLTRRFSALGHKVFVANSSGPETLKDLAAETGATPVRVEQAARSGDVVIVTIPMKSVPKLPRDLFKGVSQNVAVIDTCNYYPQRDGRIKAIENGMPESRWVEQQLGRPVIKVFNNIYAEHLLKLGRPAASEGRIALPVSSDDARTKEIVFRLVDELGFDPIDNGGLDKSMASATWYSRLCDGPRRRRCPASTICSQQRTQTGIQSTANQSRSRSGMTHVSGCRTSQRV